jgi:hypothetical protein
MSATDPSTGLAIVLNFEYGVNDYGTGWKFYMPQSQSFCIAGFTRVISEMDVDCAFDYGYNTEWDQAEINAPAWYGISTS